VIVISHSDRYITQWSLYHTVIVISHSDRYITQWSLYHTVMVISHSDSHITLVVISHSDSYITQWLLYHTVIVISHSDGYITQWWLYHTVIVISHTVIVTSHSEQNGATRFSRKRPSVKKYDCSPVHEVKQVMNEKRSLLLQIGATATNMWCMMYGVGPLNISAQQLRMTSSSSGWVRGCVL